MARIVVAHEVTADTGMLQTVIARVAMADAPAVHVGADRLESADRGFGKRDADAEDRRDQQRHGQRRAQRQRRPHRLAERHHAELHSFWDALE